MKAWASRQRSLVRSLGGAVVVGLLLLLLPSSFQSSTTAGLTEFVLLLRLSFPHFLFAPLLEMKLVHLLMMLLFVGAGRSSLGVRARGRHGVSLRCLLAWRLSLQLLRSGFRWPC